MSYPPTEEDLRRYKEEIAVQQAEHERRLQEEKAEQAREREKQLIEGLWQHSCISALTGVKMGLANKDAVKEAIQAADDVLAAFKKRFRASSSESMAHVVSIAKVP